jgi:diamine N-acetyltransferase
LVTIRRAENGDADTLALVGSATFLETFAGVLDGADIVAHCLQQHSPETYRRWLHNPAARLWLAQAVPGGAPVGYLVLDRAALPVADLSPTDYEIKRVYLLSRFQGTGVGRRLMSLAADEARLLGAHRLLLGVYKKNERAIGFYRRVGFATIGERVFQVGGRGYEDHIMAAGLKPDATNEE